MLSWDNAFRQHQFGVMAVQLTALAGALPMLLGMKS